MERRTTKGTSRSFARTTEGAATRPIEQCKEDLNGKNEAINNTKQEK